MKVYKSLICGILSLAFTSCQETLFEDLDSTSVDVVTNDNVKYEGNILTVKKNTPVDFQLNGNPDYITFYSGEFGHQYAYVDKTEYDVEDIEKMTFSFSLWSQYGYYDRGVKGRLKVYYCAGEDETTAFPGLSKGDFEADSILVETFPNWKLLTNDEELITSSTHSNSSSAGAFSVDIPTDFYNKKLTLAIVRNPQNQLVGEEYENLEGKKETALQSTFNFQDMKIVTTLKNGTSVTTYASAFGFTPLNMKNKTYFEDLEDSQFDLPADLEYGSVSGNVSGYWNLSSIASGTFSIRGCAVNGLWRYNWLVSDYINLLSKPVADVGVKVKDISQSSSAYTYTYSNVGTYRATFVLNNSNYEESQQKLCEFIVNVVE